MFKIRLAFTFNVLLIIVVLNTVMNARECSSDIQELSYDQRFAIMKEDMLMKLVILYTIKKYLIAPLQAIIVIDKENIITTAVQKNIIVQLIETMQKDPTLISLVHNPRYLNYAFSVKHNQADKELYSPEEQAYGSLLVKAFDMILTQAQTVEIAYQWIIRVMASNPYLDYGLQHDDVLIFYQTPPIQPHAKELWETMWLQFRSEKSGQ